MKPARTDWLGQAIRKAIERKGPSFKLLQMAVAFDRPDLIMLLLGKGADIHGTDQRGRTLLHLAASRRMVRTLLEAGARLQQRSDQGQTALHTATRRDRPAVARELVRAGIDIHAQDKRGLSALHLAASKGRRRAIEQLLSQGAWVNVKDRHGRSPLFLAVAAGHLPASLLLIERGADLTMLDDKGTPWLRLARLDQVAILQQTMDRVLAEEAQREWDPLAPTTLTGRLTAENPSRFDWSALDAPVHIRPYAR